MGGLRGIRGGAQRGHAEITRGSFRPYSPSGSLFPPPHLEQQLPPAHPGGLQVDDDAHVGRPLVRGDEAVRRLRTDTSASPPAAPVKHHHPLTYDGLDDTKPPLGTLDPLAPSQTPLGVRMSGVAPAGWSPRHH
eukprot:562512-Prorocentrum_minimum.AAC.1